MTTKSQYVFADSLQFGVNNFYFKKALGSHRNHGRIRKLVQGQMGRRRPTHRRLLATELGEKTRLHAASCEDVGDKKAETKREENRATTSVSF
jgi:hypothetical protein